METLYDYAISPQGVVPAFGKTFQYGSENSSKWKLIKLSPHTLDVLVFASTTGDGATNRAELRDVNGIFNEELMLYIEN